MSENNFRELTTEKNGGDSRDIIENKNRALKKIAAAIQAGTLLIALGWDTPLRASEEDSQDTETSSKIEKNETSRLPLASARSARELFVRSRIEAKTPKSEEDKQKLELLYEFFGEKIFLVPANSEVINIPKKGRLKIESLTTNEGELHKEEVKHFLSFLPKGWVKKEIGLIENKQEGDTDGEEFTGSTNDKIDAAATSYSFGESAEIIFYRSSKDQTLFDLITDIYHEVAHANSPTSDNEMSYSERLDMVLKIRNRLHSEDRYRSNYVESIKLTINFSNLNTPEKVEWVRAGEYWAVICEIYFTSPENLSAEDFILVHSFVRKTDPKFNPFKTSKKIRHALAVKFYNDRHPQKEEDNFPKSEFPPPLQPIK